MAPLPAHARAIAPLLAAGRGGNGRHNPGSQVAVLHSALHELQRQPDPGVDNGEELVDTLGEGRAAVRRNERARGPGPAGRTRTESGPLDRTKKRAGRGPDVGSLVCPRRASCAGGGGGGGGSTANVTARWETCTGCMGKRIPIFQPVCKSDPAQIF
eukprot:gene24968-biopygen16466